jgi:hypothetical protein
MRRGDKRLQGTWRCTGKRSLSAVAINFSLPGQSSTEGTIVRVDYKADRTSSNTLDGTIELRSYELTGNPLDSSVPATAGFRFIGQRILPK